MIFLNVDVVDVIFLWFLVLVYLLESSWSDGFCDGEEFDVLVFMDMCDVSVVMGGVIDVIKNWDFLILDEMLDFFI